MKTTAKKVKMVPANCTIPEEWKPVLLASAKDFGHNYCSHQRYLLGQYVESVSVKDASGKLHYKP